MFKKVPMKLAAVLMITVLFLAHSGTALGTSVDRLSLCNLEGYPGDTLQVKITLVGTDPADRSGLWDKYYKKTDGDSQQMDISSWIAFTPQDYVISQGESQVFTIEVKIPDNAAPGLWGAKTAEAGLASHADDRRSYIIFKDAVTGGNLYSGMLIPISVQVLGRSSPFAAAINILRDNALVAVLVVIIIALFTILLTRKKYRRTG